MDLFFTGSIAGFLVEVFFYGLLYRLLPIIYSVLRLSAPSEEKPGIIKYNGDLENFSNKRERYGKY